MATDINTYMIMAMPWIKTIVWLFMGLGSTVGLGYYLFVIKRRRYWVVNLWEKKADDRLHFIGRDKIVERKVNKGKQAIFMLKKYRTEVFPPPWECTYRYYNKEYTDYLRIREDDFQPMNRNLDLKGGNLADKPAFFNRIRNAINNIKKEKKEDVYDKYVYSPINNQLVIGMKFEAMDYDINMMRINAIDNRDKIYADKLDFFQKYGQYVVLGMIVVLIIVVLYMSYDYSSNVIGQAMGKAQETLSIVEQMAGRMGGSPPPS